LQLVTQVPASIMAPQMLGVPAPPQVKPPEHPPQSMGVPQPLSTKPQYLPEGPWSQTVGVQTPESSMAPHWFGIPPPPQVYPGVSQVVPQSQDPSMHPLPIRLQYCPPPGGLQTKQAEASTAPASLPGSMGPMAPPTPEPPVPTPVPPAPALPPLPPLLCVVLVPGDELLQAPMSTTAASAKNREAHLNLMGVSP
jgi:hypothetical protein